MAEQDRISTHTQRHQGLKGVRGESWDPDHVQAADLGAKGRGRTRRRGGLRGGLEAPGAGAPNEWVAQGELVPPTVRERVEHPYRARLAELTGDRGWMMVAAMAAGAVAIAGVGALLWSRARR